MAQQPVFRSRSDVLEFISHTVGCSKTRAREIMSYADVTTLRDEFAREVSAGLVKLGLDATKVARQAYEIADAMLEERDKL